MGDEKVIDLGSDLAFFVGENGFRGFSCIVQNMDGKLDKLDGCAVLHMDIMRAANGHCSS